MVTWNFYVAECSGKLLQTRFAIWYFYGLVGFFQRVIIRSHCPRSKELDSKIQAFSQSLIDHVRPGGFKDKRPQERNDSMKSSLATCHLVTVERS